MPVVPVISPQLTEPCEPTLNTCQLLVSNCDKSVLTGLPVASGFTSKSSQPVGPKPLDPKGSVATIWLYCSGPDVGGVPGALCAGGAPGPPCGKPTICSSPVPGMLAKGSSICGSCFGWFCAIRRSPMGLVA